MTTQYGFFIDSARCTGCKTCELACKDYKDLTPGRQFPPRIRICRRQLAGGSGYLASGRFCLLPLSFL